MRGRQRGGLVWQIRLAGPQLPRLDVDVRLFQPTAAPGQVMPLVEMQLDDQQHFADSGRGRRRPAPSPSPLPRGGGEGTEKRASSRWSLRKGGREETEKAGIQDISVCVRNCVLLAERQRQLFDEAPRLDGQELAQLVNRLASRLGADQVVRPRLVRRGAQPEEAACFESLVGGAETVARPQPNGERRRRPAARKPAHDARRTGMSAPRDSGHPLANYSLTVTGQAARHAEAISPLQRPLVLLPQPQSILAVSLDGRPETDIHTPTMFVIDGQRLSVTRRWGPERIETSWWRGPVIRRDYWRIETRDGRWLWVFRNLREGTWHLHGEF
jgi:hypothetical protein